MTLLHLKAFKKINQHWNRFLCEKLQLSCVNHNVSVRLISNHVFIKLIPIEQDIPHSWLCSRKTEISDEIIFYSTKEQLELQIVHLLLKRKHNWFRSSQTKRLKSFDVETVKWIVPVKNNGTNTSNKGDIIHQAST